MKSYLLFSILTVSILHSCGSSAEENDYLFSDPEDLDNDGKVSIYDDSLKIIRNWERLLDEDPSMQEEIDNFTIKQIWFDDIDRALSREHDKIYWLKLIHNDRLSEDDLYKICSFPNIEILDLYASVNSNLPACIFELEHLKILDLSSNKLDSTTAKFGRLSSLEELYLDGCYSKKIPESIFELDNLKELWLGNNELESLSTSIQNLKNLKWIKLADNNFTEVPEVLCQLPSLEVIDISGNRITELPACLCKLPNLKRINVWGNLISMIPVEFQETEIDLRF